jgi:hypothetical protein
MPARAGEAVFEPARDAVITSVDDLILARIACEGGATRSDLTRDVGPLMQHKFSPAEVRSAIDSATSVLAAAGLIAESRSRFSATAKGRERAAQFTVLRGSGEPAWEEIINVALTAKALELDFESDSRKKSLSRPEGLRTAILQKTYGLKGKKNIPDAKLRAQLALVALERAFGNKIKAGFSKGSGLPSKAARTLAGQLAASPREFPTDAKLIAQLAADAVGAPQTDPEAVRLALLRRMVSCWLDTARSGAPRQRGSTPAESRVPAELVQNAANDSKPKGPPPRPGLDEFASAVRRAAHTLAQGWPKKAFISQVWEIIRVEHEIWALSEIEFKSMLTLANRQGAIALVTADLKNQNRQDIERSATPDRNTVWHYIRIED